LISFEARMKARAAQQYRVELLIWAARSPHLERGGKMPTLPDILRED
jgi:hypothetical protein